MSWSRSAVSSFTFLLKAVVMAENCPSPGPHDRHLCYQKMPSARMSRGETLVLVMQPAQDRPTHDLALAPGR